MEETWSEYIKGGPSLWWEDGEEDGVRSLYRWALFWFSNFENVLGGSWWTIALGEVEVDRTEQKLVGYGTYIYTEERGSELVLRGPHPNVHLNRNHYLIVGNRRKGGYCVKGERLHATRGKILHSPGKLMVLLGQVIGELWRCTSVKDLWDRRKRGAITWMRWQFGGFSFRGKLVLLGASVKTTFCVRGTVSICIATLIGSTGYTTPVLLHLCFLYFSAFLFHLLVLRPFLAHKVRWKNDEPFNTC